MGRALSSQSALSGFIANSLKFRSAHDPEIQISIEDQGPNWLFKFQDNGRGFDPTESEKIFSLYTRGLSSQVGGKAELQGAGIGLATARRVVELHGGKIWASSEPGQGATFFFTLPKLDSLH